MSAQFGTWNFDTSVIPLSYIHRADELIAPYGPDRSNSYSDRGVALLYRAFQTTEESQNENQPHTSRSGVVVTWDGRLDNRAELIPLLRNVLEARATDVDVVGAAYELWGTDCFGKFIGDWAAAIWDPHSHAVILAKDVIGTRHLYYCLDTGRAAWSSTLDLLLLLSDRAFSLSEEYLAGWYSFFPAVHLTPYSGICAVPPASFVCLGKGRANVRKYWDFDAARQIRYRSDAEYEEHFRTVFFEAVSRRLRSHKPVLAELSGGVDSSSIVCAADKIISLGHAETPRLDTVSYYDDTEPTWNESAYFSEVEEQRGRIGCHIDLGSQPLSRIDCESGFAVAPGAWQNSSSAAARQFSECIAAQGNRVVLSGIGGDEITGGVPTPSPELQDLMVDGDLRCLALQLTKWALDRRQPWFHLLSNAAQGFLPASLGGLPKEKRPANWLLKTFVARNRFALSGYHERLKVFGPRPSFQENMATLANLQRQVACDFLREDPLYETRYPFLDRDLLEFIYALPREQLLRPGQRRSLMRRAMAGIVPDKVLNRKRKAFVVRRPMAEVACQWEQLREPRNDMVSGSLGLIDTSLLAKNIELARAGREVPCVQILRTLEIERWLRTWERWSARDRGSLTSMPEACESLFRL